MADERYLNREIDEKFEGVHQKLDTIIEQVKYTNGKVKRIIVAVISLGSFMAGIGIKEGAPLIKAAIALL